MITRGDKIICISDQLDDFVESAVSVTIGKEYECRSVWNTSGVVYVGFFDDKGLYKNLMREKFILPKENYFKRRFEKLLSR